MKSSKLCPVLLFVLFSTLAVTGCGGGGGGGGSGESVNYDGNTSSAVIDTTSALGLARNAVVAMGRLPGGVSVSEPLGGAAFRIADDPAGPSIPAASRLSGDAAAARLNESPEPLSVQCESEIFDTGSVGGSLWIQACVDPDTLGDDQYWMSFGYDFRELEDPGEYIDGMYITQGVWDDMEELFVGGVRSIFRDLTIRRIGRDSYWDGWVDYVENEPTYTATYNIFVVDNLRDSAIWLDNYVVSANDTIDTQTIDGRLYDDIRGYVVVSTANSLSWAMSFDHSENVLNFDPYPSGGELRLTGAGGAWIGVQFRYSLGKYELRVGVDLDNNQTEDWTTGWQPWVPAP